jgi:hypothetical protein
VDELSDFGEVDIKNAAGDQVSESELAAAK